MDEMINGLAGDVKAVNEKLAGMPSAEDIQKSIDENRKATEDAQELRRELGVMANDVDGIRKLLKHNLGKSGAEDMENALNVFVQKAWHHKHKLPEPAHLQKADYVLDVSATGGYLAPTLVANEVIKIGLAHGQIFPELNKVTVPAGVAITMPWENAYAGATWRAGASSGVQGVAGTEQGSITWGADSLRPEWVHGYSKIANEAMTAPGISVAQNLVTQLTTAVIRTIEDGVLAGYVGSATAHTGRTAPHNGILRASSVNAQTALATPTFALLNTFIGECIVDRESAANEDEMFVCTTGAVGHRFKSLLTQQGNNWGDVTQGIQSRIMGYNFRTSPYIHRTLTDTKRSWIIMSPLRKVTVAWSGTIGIDFNDRGEGWTHNETWLRVGTHADFALGNPAEHHRAQVTALA